ncbi:FYVE, RhoGEF and PH domain-containing protein 4-like isoform X1 [Synchiropus splendidus]|uniref:FYVE, RhoGEF and PH domain-containing protein 4-like isoform X1 n=1 Tax=Synchiropus splendidus TaxID=270530 RepID=UPI00237DADE3|nr:FYVE, RhoGEF and PH domain-containing protein 4-like isoform X1 [Synchiropus splendidus]
MFDRKKRNSLTLNCNAEAEEFRRVAVRRKVKGAAEHTVVTSGVCGSYSCDPACDRIGASIPNPSHAAGKIERVNATRRSPNKPQVPPKPAHLQSPLRGDSSPTSGKFQSQPVKGAKDQNQSPACDVSVLIVHPTPNGHGSPSPIRERSRVAGSQISPGSLSQGVPCRVSSPVLGSPSPGRRSLPGRCPGKEEGFTPVKLSPRNRSPLAGILRTPSPVQPKHRFYSPAKKSKSWLGMHSKMDGQEKKVGKSLSVPNLIHYCNESGISSDDRSPLKPLQLLNCGTNKSHPKLQQALSEEIPHLSITSSQLSPGQMNGITPGVDARAEIVPVLFCPSTGAPLEYGRIPKGGDTDVEMGSKNDEKDEKKRAEQKLFQIATELLQTERAYVTRLHLLDRVFCARLTEEAGRGSFPPEVIKNIFSNISSIFSFHSQFVLPDLEKCISSWCESPGLGNVLLRHAPFLRMYADYVSNFDQAMELVRTWTERSSAFRNVVRDIQSQEVCGNLSLQHHMLEPIQRVPRYELLLRDYLKVLPKDNADYQLAQKSLQTISMAATHSNSAIHRAEGLKRLLEIYEMVGEEEVVNPTNEFLKEGRLLKLAARNTSAMERHLFLFNNFLLCCSPKFCLVGQRFTVRSRIGVDSMQVQPTTNEDHAHTFQVSGKEKTLELQASSEQERDEWIKMIREAISVFQKKNETFKLASKEFNVEQPVEELGKRAPRWIRDNEVTLCMKCQEPFNALTRRRHHCRACGCVVCWKCSDYKVALEYDGNKLNKVCKSCFSTLTGQRGERAEGKKRRTQELETPPVLGDAVFSGFLLYGYNPKTLQRLWCVLTRTEPPTLCLYSASQDVKPFSIISLLECSVQDCPPELSGQSSFTLRDSSSTHSFTCDTSELRHHWLTLLKDSMNGGCHKAFVNGNS